MFLNFLFSIPICCPKSKFFCSLSLNWIFFFVFFVFSDSFLGSSPSINKSQRASSSFDKIFFLFFSFILFTSFCNYKCPIWVRRFYISRKSPKIIVIFNIIRISVYSFTLSILNCIYLFCYIFNNYTNYGCIK